MSWPVVKLKDIAELINGDRSKNYPSGEDIVDSGVLFLNSKNIIDNRLNLKVKNFITLDKFESLSRGKLQLNDLVITLRGTLGNCCIFNSEYTTGFINAQMMIIRSSKQVDPCYLYYFITSANTKKIFERLNTGSAVPQLTGKQVGELEIPLPPLAEQKRIAAILDKADAICQKRQQAIKLADEFLRSVFLEMFGDPVTNPMGLKKAPITDLADVITGFAFKSNEYVSESDDSVRLCRGANTLTGYFDWGDTVFWPKHKLEKLDNYLIQENDIILAMDRPWISSGLKVCVFPKNQPTTYLVQRVARLRPKLPVFSDYIYSCIKSQSFETHCCPTETTVPHISPVELKKFEILIPDEHLILKYHAVVSSINKTIQSLENFVEDSENMFNSLSQKAFSGQI